MNRSNLISKIILGITIGILIFGVYSTIKKYDITDLNSTTKNLKTANFWELTNPISIDDANPSNDWSKTASDNDWCSGSGTYSDPYIIENVIIQPTDLISGIMIKNSYVNFIIKNCTILNIKSTSFLSETYDYGIKLDNVANGKLIDNNVSNNQQLGIHLYYSDNITLSGNLANDNSECGIRLQVSSNNAIIGNTFSENGEVGIEINNLSKNNTISQNTVSNNDNGVIVGLECNNNTITECTINDNLLGILLSRANGNTIIGNILTGNKDCIEEFQSSYNTIENNDCREHESSNGSAVPGYDLAILTILIGVVSTLSAIIFRKRFKNTKG
ncbi:MAG: nitrous oxide reductase family maturation protein NosD [Candidatus Odinarchaeota archaeon]